MTGNETLASRQKLSPNCIRWDVLHVFCWLVCLPKSHYLEMLKLLIWRPTLKQIAFKSVFCSYNNAPMHWSMLTLKTENIIRQQYYLTPLCISFRRGLLPSGTDDCASLPSLRQNLPTVLPSIPSLGSCCCPTLTVPTFARFSFVPLLLRFVPRARKLGWASISSCSYWSGGRWGTSLLAFCSLWDGSAEWAASDSSLKRSIGVFCTYHKFQGSCALYSMHESLRSACLHQQVFLDF